MAYRFRPARSAGISKGYMTIEASFIIPIILFIAVTLIYLFMHLYEREYLRGELYRNSCSVPYHISKDDGETVQYVNGIAPETESLFGSESRQAECRSGSLTIKGEIDFKVESEFKVQRETWKCTDRLRRWQLYESFTEE